MKQPLLFAAAFAAAFSSAASAQVQVIDSAPDGREPSSRGQNSGASGAGANQLTELYYQMQTLQQEVMNLRGQVEEQSHEIKRLKQQRLDDYLDLDRRVSALTKGGAATVEKSPAASDDAELDGLPGPGLPVDNEPRNQATPDDGGDSGNEEQVYASAYDLLKQRQIDASIEAFRDHLSRFPRGEYASNSYYWLGEIYLLKNNLPEAQRWFGDLLAEFPDSRKVPDAQFKLGKVYHLQGEEERAKELLDIVAASGADASRLAEQYLQDNF